MRPRGTLDRELNELRSNLLHLGWLVDRAVANSVQALVDHNSDLAHEIIADDGGVNALRFQIEEHFLEILATQQPAASDLRAIVAAFSVTDNLERMADHAKGIAEIVIRIGDQPFIKPLIDIPRMTEQVRAMLRRGLDAYATGDVELATEVCKMDDLVDGLYQQVLRELLTLMIENPRNITQGTYLLWVAHNLERIGDRATNIGERVIFMRTGRMEELNVKETGPWPASDLTTTH
jgi:phosphate transport system protein